MDIDVSGAAPHPFVVNEWIAIGIALLALLVPLLIAHGLVSSAQKPRGLKAQRRQGIKALVVGADGRMSTSKVSAFLWTFAVLFGIVFLFAWGRSTGCGVGDGASAHACSQANDGHAAWHQFARQKLPAEYYALLGFPVTAAVAAKGLTQAKADTGTLTKTQPTEDGLLASARELVTNDGGETDLLDFQYFAFNLLTLAFFAVQFLSKPANGLPAIPPTLIALSGLSAAAYTAKKGLEADSPPLITAVVPEKIRLDRTSDVIVTGVAFGDDSPTNGADTNGADTNGADTNGADTNGADTNGDGPSSLVSRAITIAGLQLTDTWWSDRQVRGRVTKELIDAFPDATAGSPSVADLVVIDDRGIPSDPVQVQLYKPPTRGSSR